MRRNGRGQKREESGVVTVADLCRIYTNKRKSRKGESQYMYKKIKKKPTKIIVVPHYVGTEKDTKVFKKIIEEKVQKKIKETA